jgi:acyl-CoA thioester hydrolase
MSNSEKVDNLLEQALKLPCTHQQVIPPDYMDLNGHMNVMYYTHVGNMALHNFFDSMGLHKQLFQPGLRGMFALRQVISYVNELREGEEIELHSGLVDYDHKRIHFMHYIVSLTNNRVAAYDERLAMYIDMSVRRSTTFEPEILEQLEPLKLSQQAAGWKPQLSGAIQLRKN